MKKILLLVFFANAIFGAQDLDKLYLEKGITAVRDAIEINLQNKAHWEEKLAPQDLKYGYYERPTFITVVDKTAKKIAAFKFENGKLSKLSSNEVLTGLMGDKLKEGDLKTPVGTYEVTRKFTPSDRYYGPVAWSLSYPNVYDKVRHRDGGGIWIHGYPMDGNVREDTIKTKGCVVMKNDLLTKYEKLVGENKGGVVLINEKGVKEASNAQIAAIFAELFKWKMAWTISDANAYLSFYDKDFTRFDGMKMGRFAEMKKQIFSRKENKFISFTNFVITPYPSTEKGDFFRVTFNEKYLTQSYQFEGVKTLYVRLDGSKMKILVEE